MRVFLSGDTRGEWQSKIQQLFPNHTYFDPRTLSKKSYKEMAETERDWIDQSDIIFAYLNKSNPYGFGTCFEIGYCVAHKKIIIYIDEKQVSSSKWIAEHPVYAYNNFDAGINKLGELLAKGNALIAEGIVNSLTNQDFTILVKRELDDKLVEMVAARIYDDPPMYTRLMLASKMLPRIRYDWNLGYLLQKLNAATIIPNLEKYAENLYHSEGIAWALGLIGNEDERIINFLQEQCRRCEDYDAWWCAAHSLQQLNHGDAIEILKRTMIKSEWQSIDHCLEHLGERPATIGLLRMVNKGNLNKIVESCLQGLITLRERRLHNTIWLLERFRLHDSKILNSLMKLHETKVEYGSSVTHRVVEALGQIAHPSSRHILEKDLLEAGYFRTRAWAAKGLGMIGDYKSIVPLERALINEKDPHVLSMITSALYSIRDQEKRNDNKYKCESGWLENGMIIDETNRWYWSPEIYDKFSHAEDPENISFQLALSYLQKNTHIALDLGSGTGRFVEELKKRNGTIHKIYALDNSVEMTEYLRKKFSRDSSYIEIIQSPISKIPLADNSVDLIVSSWGFPSHVWDEKLAYAELKEVTRVLKPKGKLVTVGWDEEFSDEMTEVWYRFAMESEYCFDSLSEYRRKKRAKIKSPRNCGLTMVKKRIQVPVKFKDKQEAAYILGHIFGYSAGVWILDNARKEFQMHVGITCDDKPSLESNLAQRAQII